MKVVVLLYPGVTALDAIGPYEVLSRVPGGRVVFAAKEPGPSTTDTGMLDLVARGSLDDNTDADVLVVPGGAAGTLRACGDATIIRWLRAVAQTSTWITSVCTGALLLGAAGLLKGKRATTHWMMLDQLTNFGALQSPERVVRDGQLITAQGVSAGIDMGLQLAELISGKATAEAIQLALEYAPEPPFQSGSIAHASDATIRAARRMLLSV